MTRLSTHDVQDISAGLKAYDLSLKRKTDCTLKGLACHAAGIHPDSLSLDAVRHFRFGIIPVTTGKGVIQGFSDAVYGILSHLGFDAFITQETDVAGLAEAFRKNAHGIMMADDTSFVAVDIRSRQVIDNSVATAMGYVAGLDLMVGGLAARKVLIMGCGPVGGAAVRAVISRGGGVKVFDIASSRAFRLKASLEQGYQEKVEIEENLETALRSADLIIDATPDKNIILAHHIRPETYISAPGVPLGIESAAAVELGDRLLHDPLQIGVATMAFSILKCVHENLLKTNEY